MDYKLEKGKKYKISYYDDLIECEFLGIWSRTSGSSSINKMIFKSSEGYVLAFPDIYLLADGTIYIKYIYDRNVSSLDELKHPPTPPKETIELYL